MKLKNQEDIKFRQFKIGVKEIVKGFVIIYDDDSWAFWEESAPCYKQLKEYWQKELRSS